MIVSVKRAVKSKTQIWPPTALDRGGVVKVFDRYFMYKPYPFSCMTHHDSNLRRRKSGANQIKHRKMYIMLAFTRDKKLY